MSPPAQRTARAGLFFKGRPTRMQYLSARLGSLPDNVRGALWILLSAVIFTATNSLIKHVGTTMDSFQMVFFRGLFGTLFLLPIVWRGGGWEVLKSNRMSFHLARGLTGSLALMTIFYALTHMPLADVTIVAFGGTFSVVAYTLTTKLSLALRPSSSVTVKTTRYVPGVL